MTATEFTGQWKSSLANRSNAPKGLNKESVMVAKKKAKKTLKKKAVKKTTRVKKTISPAPMPGLTY